MTNRLRITLAAIAALVVTLLPAVALAQGATAEDPSLDWRAVLVVGVTLLLFVARVLSRSEAPTLWALLPVWADITTWPRLAQPIVPFVAAAAPPLIVDLQSGADILASLQVAAMVGLGAIGLYHAGKKVLGAKPEPVIPTISANELLAKVDAMVANSKPSGKPPLSDVCRGCGETLVEWNWVVADGCPCNSTRGVNHGLVPAVVCTCTVCDPEQTGSSRYGRQPRNTQPDDLPPAA